MFFKEDDQTHMDFYRESATDQMNVERLFVKNFEIKGLTIEAVEKQDVLAKPTPKGVILKGAAINGVPIEDTKLTFATMIRKKRG